VRNIVRIYNVRLALTGAMYDANKALTDGDVHKAYKILKKKLAEIEKINNSTWEKAEWEL
jgi:hypothetical protein